MDLERFRTVRLMTFTSKPQDDPFLRGPLGQSAFADDAVRAEYLELTYGSLRVAAEDVSGVAGLPARTTLSRHAPSQSLFDYQVDLAEQMQEIVEDRRRPARALLALPTGAGKTRTAMSAVLGLIRAGKIEKALWLAPSRELLDQGYETLVSLWRADLRCPTLEVLRCHAIGGLPKCDGRAVYFATPQMLSRRLARGGAAPHDWGLTVFDEAHQAVAPSFGRAFLAAERGNTGVAASIGLSATPGRRDDASTDDLVSLFASRLLKSHLLSPNPIEVLTKCGVLAALEFCPIEVAHRVIGQRQVLSASEHLREPWEHLDWDLGRFSAVVKAILDCDSRSRSLVFAGSIAHANAIGCALRGCGRNVGVLTSNTPLPERGRLVEDFRAGRIVTLVNKSILATGFDVPGLSGIFLATVIGSPILFEQMVGRASRGPAVGGLPSAIIWQLDDHLAIHGRPASYYRFRDFDWS